MEFKNFYKVLPLFCLFSFSVSSFAQASTPDIKNLIGFELAKSLMDQESLDQSPILSSEDPRVVPFKNLVHSIEIQSNEIFQSLAQKFLSEDSREHPGTLYPYRSLITEFYLNDGSGEDSLSDSLTRKFYLDWIQKLTAGCPKQTSNFEEKEETITELSDSKCKSENAKLLSKTGLTKLIQVKDTDYAVMEIALVTADAIFYDLAAIQESLLENSEFDKDTFQVLNDLEIPVVYRGFQVTTEKSASQERKVQGIPESLMQSGGFLLPSKIAQISDLNHKMTLQYILAGGDCMAGCNSWTHWTLTVEPKTSSSSNQTQFNVTISDPKVIRPW